MWKLHHSHFQKYCSSFNSKTNFICQQTNDFHGRILAITCAINNDIICSSNANGLLTQHVWMFYLPPQEHSESQTTSACQGP